MRETATNEDGVHVRDLGGDRPGPRRPGDPPAPLSLPTDHGHAGGRPDPDGRRRRPGRAPSRSPSPIQWQRCDPTGGGCTDVTGRPARPTSSARADVGAHDARASDGHERGGSASATSRDHRPVVEACHRRPLRASCSRADATGCAAIAGSRVSLLNQKLHRATARSPRSPRRTRSAAGPGTPPAPGRGRLHDLRRPQPGGRRPPAGLRRRRRRRDDRPHPRGRGRRPHARRHGRRDQGAPHCPRHPAHRLRQLRPARHGPDGLPGHRDDPHQDGAQIQGGDTIEFIDFEWGDWETSTATCQGAAGTFVPGSVNGTPSSTWPASAARASRATTAWRSAPARFARRARCGGPATPPTAVPLANGEVGLCRFGGPACMVDDDPHTASRPATNP